MAQTAHKPLVSTLLGRHRGISTRADIEWERIMVQITFAFVIILGYLISVEMHQSRELAAETAAYRRQNMTLSTIISDFSGTEAGEERKQRLVAERELQLQKLLNAWEQVRTDRELYRGLMQFRHAELIDLSDDLKCLPASDGFAKFADEVERVFLPGSGDVSSDEVADLLSRVLTQAGFDLRLLEQNNENGELPPDAEDLYFDPRKPTKANLEAVTIRITADLRSEREETADIQWNLVGRISHARLNKAADMPRGEAQTLDVDVTELASRMFEKILHDLRAEVALLPETADRIRGNQDADTDSPPTEKPRP